MLRAWPRTLYRTENGSFTTSLASKNEHLFFRGASRYKLPFMYNHGIITVFLIAFLRLRAALVTFIHQNQVMTKDFLKPLKVGALRKGKRVNSKNRCYETYSY